MIPGAHCQAGLLRNVPLNLRQDKNRLTLSGRFGIKNLHFGAVAQLGERLTGSQEVDSSILFSSTINI